MHCQAVFGNEMNMTKFSFLPLFPKRFHRIPQAYMFPTRFFPALFPCSPIAKYAIFPRNQDRILVEMLGQVQIDLGEVPHGMLGLRMYSPVKVNYMTYACTVYICISVFMNYDCTTYPILLFITLLQSLFRNIPLKGHLIQRWWAVISFSSVDSNQRITNFTSII
jgi:hypothetical protein